MEIKLWKLLKRFPTPSGALAPTVLCLYLLLRIVHISIHGILSVSVTFLDRDDTRMGRFQHIRFSEKVTNFACDKNTELLIMVVTTPEEYDRRLGVRKTWGSPLRYNSSSTKLLFVTGVTHYYNTGEENADFKDIVQTNVQEMYYNLSLKTLALLVFANRFCPRVRCVVKADADNILNIPAFEKYCRENYESPSIVGHCEVTRSVNRDRFKKWFVPPHVYKSDHYPRYCSSGAYMFVGQKTAANILDALPQTGFYESENTRRMPEDVLFTGIVPSMISLPRVHNAGFNFWEWPTVACLSSSSVAFSVHAPLTNDPLFEYNRMLSVSGKYC